MKKRHLARLKKKKIKNDFSDSTVIIMLLLLVVISIMSIVFYLQALSMDVPKAAIDTGPAVGEVTVTIVKAPAEARPQPDDLNNQPS